MVLYSQGMTKSYDPNCTLCRYSRPGNPTTHADHPTDSNDLPEPGHVIINPDGR